MVDGDLLSLTLTPDLIRGPWCLLVPKVRAEKWILKQVQDDDNG